MYVRQARTVDAAGRSHPHARTPADANAITDVDQALLAAVRIGAPAPPVAARDIAMVGISMFML
jgi:hypothetical protein